MAKTLGYIRVSTAEQNTDRQLEELLKAGVEETGIYTDKVSGKDANRPQLQELLKRAGNSDTVYVHSMDRLARNMKDLLCIVDDLIGRGVSVHFIKENLNLDVSTDSPTARLTLQLIGAFAEYERNMIKSRQREGIALAKERKAYKGRQQEMTADRLAEIQELVKMKVPQTEIAKKFGISRGTVYLYLKGKRKVEPSEQP